MTGAKSLSKLNPNNYTSLFMCLINTSGDQPYNASDIRWKLFRVTKDGTFSPFQKFEFKSGRNVAEISPLDSDTGFHVFVTHKDARDNQKASQAYAGHALVVRKVKVAGFVSKGTWEWAFSTHPRNEIWKTLTVLS